MIYNIKGSINPNPNPLYQKKNPNPNPITLHDQRASWSGYGSSQDEIRICIPFADAVERHVSRERWSHVAHNGKPEARYFKRAHTLHSPPPPFLLF